jgi:pimeloyl-ACP methyl ester carboxylesterase
VRYAPLVSALGDEVQFQTKDLEVYAGEEPPAGYSIELEVEALSRFADSLQLDRFHLLGYSGGGFVSLAFAGAYPDRLLSLALFEPALVPGELSTAEAAHDAQLRRAVTGLATERRSTAAIGAAPTVDALPAGGYRGNDGGVQRGSVRPGSAPRVPFPGIPGLW